MSLDRRRLLAGLSTGLVAALPMPALADARSDQPSSSFTVDPRQYGAKGDGKSLDTGAINAAIDACASRGGGTVWLAPGTYLSGTVILKSNITLHLEAGATLLGSTRFDDYTSPAGTHLIVARNAENVTLRGPGRIDGQGSAFWKPSPHPPLPPDQSWAGVVSHDWTANGRRPSPMLEFSGCRYLRLEDLRIENAPSWTLRPLNCEQVFIRGVAIKNLSYGPNTDGIDITGCTGVLVSDCTIDTGDDALCIKSEAPYGGEPLINRNIVVTNCVITTSCNGFKLGTGSQGGFENITFSNSVIYNNPVSLPERVISGIALEVVDGGWIDGVIVTGIRMQRARTPIFIRLGNRGKNPATPQNGLRNVMIQDVQASESVLASSITGLPGSNVENVTLSSIHIENVLPARGDWAGVSVPEVPEKYPEARMFGMLPVSGLYARHVRGLQLRDLAIRTAQGEQRPALLCDDVSGLRVSQLGVTPAPGNQPIVALAGCHDAWITDSAAPQGTGVFLDVAGGDSASILLSGCDLRQARQPIQTSAGASSGAVTESSNITR